MLPGRSYRPEDLLRVAWKRKWFLLVPFLVCATATVLVTRRLPNLYRSDTLILVVPQRVPESYVRSTVSGRIEDRLQSLQQQILSRSRLERIILDLNLYQEQRRIQPFEGIVQRVRAGVKVETVRGDAFTVSYVAHDPKIAQAVTERLASLFIEENVRDREVLAEGTSQFLQTQLDEARQRLIEQEKKLEAYRLRHPGELPSQVPSNLQALQNAQVQLQTLSSAIQRHRERQVWLERQMGDLAGESAAPVASTAPQPLSTEEQLQQARARLAELSARLTPAHPDLGRQARLVTKLEKKAAAEREKPASAAASPRTAAELTRERRLRDLRSEADSVEREIAATQLEEERLRAQMAEYRARLDAAPIRESEMTELTRDYETLQEIYRTLLAKREDSKIAANLERRQVGEQFRVLDPARAPEQPFSPNRTRLNMMGAFLGLLLGVGICVLLEYLDNTLKTEDDIRTVLALPVIATIPVLAAGARQRASGHRLLWPVTAGAVAAIGVLVRFIW